MVRDHYNKYFVTLINIRRICINQNTIYNNYGYKERVGISEIGLRPLGVNRKREVSK